jgi:hypothetical protein
MFQNYHHGLAICRVHGPPDFFVRFTCNLAWVEIVESFFLNMARHGSDGVVRVFHSKLDDLLDDIRSGTIFGPLVADTILDTQ